MMNKHYIRCRISKQKICEFVRCFSVGLRALQTAQECCTSLWNSPGSIQTSPKTLDTLYKIKPSQLGMTQIF